MIISEEALRKQINAVCDLNKVELFTCKDEMNYLFEIITDTEVVKYLAWGYYNNSIYVLAVITDKRIIFLGKEWFSKKQIELMYNNINSIQHVKGLIFSSVQIDTIRGSVLLSQLSSENAQKFTEIVSKIIQEGTRVSNSNNIDSDDVISKIERLGILKEKGLITDDEFHIQKGKILKEME